MMKLYSADLSPYSARIRMQIYAKGITDIVFELPEHWGMPKFFARDFRAREVQAMAGTHRHRVSGSDPSLPEIRTWWAHPPLGDTAWGAQRMLSNPGSGQRQARPDQAGTGRLSARLGGALVRLVVRVLGWNRARRQRLPAHLGDHALRDIGIDRATAEDDSTVTFWRLR